MLFSCFLINRHSWVLSFLIEMKIWTFDPSYHWKGGFIWEYYYKISFSFSFGQILVYVLFFLLVNFSLTLTLDVWVSTAESFAHTCRFATKKQLTRRFKKDETIVTITVMVVRTITEQWWQHQVPLQILEVTALKHCFREKEKSYLLQCCY